MTVGAVDLLGAAAVAACSRPRSWRAPGRRWPPVRSARCDSDRRTAAKCWAGTPTGPGRASASTCPRSDAGSVTCTIVFSLPFDSTLYLRLSVTSPSAVLVTSTSDLEALRRETDLVGLLYNGLRRRVVFRVDWACAITGHNRSRAERSQRAAARSQVRGSEFDSHRFTAPNDNGPSLVDPFR